MATQSATTGSAPDTTKISSTSCTPAMAPAAMATDDTKSASSTLSNGKMSQHGMNNSSTGSSKNKTQQPPAGSSSTGSKTTTLNPNASEFIPGQFSVGAGAGAANTGVEIAMQNGTTSTGVVQQQLFQVPGTMGAATPAVYNASYSAQQGAGVTYKGVDFRILNQQQTMRQPEVFHVLSTNNLGQVFASPYAYTNSRKGSQESAVTQQSQQLVSLTQGPGMQQQPNLGNQGVYSIGAVNPKMQQQAQAAAAAQQQQQMKQATAGAQQQQHLKQQQPHLVKLEGINPSTGKPTKLVPTEIVQNVAKKVSSKTSSKTSSNGEAAKSQDSKNSSSDKPAKDSKPAKAPKLESPPAKAGEEQKDAPASGKTAPSWTRIAAKAATKAKTPDAASAGTTVKPADVVLVPVKGDGLVASTADKKENKKSSSTADGAETTEKKVLAASTSSSKKPEEKADAATEKLAEVKKENKPAPAAEVEDEWQEVKKPKHKVRQSPEQATKKILPWGMSKKEATPKVSASPNKVEGSTTSSSEPAFIVPAEAGATKAESNSSSSAEEPAAVQKAESSSTTDVAVEKKAAVVPASSSTVKEPIATSSPTLTAATKKVPSSVEKVTPAPWRRPEIHDEKKEAENAAAGKHAAGVAVADPATTATSSKQPATSSSSSENVASSKSASTAGASIPKEKKPVSISMDSRPSGSPKPSIRQNTGTTTSDMVSNSSPSSVEEALKEQAASATGEKRSVTSAGAAASEEPILQQDQFPALGGGSSKEVEVKSSSVAEEEKKEDNATSDAKPAMSSWAAKAAKAAALPVTESKPRIQQGGEKAAKGSAVDQLSKEKSSKGKGKDGAAMEGKGKDQKGQHYNSTSKENNSSILQKGISNGKTHDKDNNFQAGFSGEQEPTSSMSSSSSTAVVPQPRSSQKGSSSYSGKNMIPPRDISSSPDAATGEKGSNKSGSLHQDRRSGASNSMIKPSRNSRTGKDSTTTPAKPAPAPQAVPDLQKDFPTMGGSSKSVLAAPSPVQPPQGAWGAKPWGNNIKTATSSSEQKMANKSSGSSEEEENVASKKPVEQPQPRNPNASVQDIPEDDTPEEEEQQQPAATENNSKTVATEEEDDLIEKEDSSSGNTTSSIPLLEKQASVPSTTTAEETNNSSSATASENDTTTTSVVQKTLQQSSSQSKLKPRLVAKPVTGGFAFNSSFVKLSEAKNLPLETPKTPVLETTTSSAVNKTPERVSKKKAASEDCPDEEEPTNTKESPELKDTPERSPSPSSSSPVSSSEENESPTPAPAVPRYEPEVLKPSETEIKPCPSEIPMYLRAGYRKQNAPPTDRVYALKFMKQFQDKANCLALPPGVKLPAAISKDGRVSSAGQNGSGGDQWARGQRLAELPDKEHNKKNRKSNNDNWQRQSAPVLESGENSWKKQQQEMRQGDNIDRDAEIERKAKAILNKLTFEKFDKLYAELTNLGMYKYGQLEYLTKEIFEKATTQHHFIEMYTLLCKKIHDENAFSDCFASDDAPVSPTAEAGGEEDSKSKPTFKRMLLSICQDLFEKEEEEIVADNKDEETEKYFAYKKKRLGNVKFVGNLLINKLLTIKVVGRVLQDLLQRRTELSLEAACVFIESVGQFVEQQNALAMQKLEQENLQNEDLNPLTQKEKEKKLPVKAWTGIFSELAHLSEDPELNFRSRALIKDLIDLKMAGWVKNTTLQKEPLKAGKIADIEKAVLDEENNKLLQKKSSSSVTIVDADGFATVKSGKQRPSNNGSLGPKTQSTNSVRNSAPDALQRAGSSTGSFANLASGSRFAALEKSKKKKSTKKDEEEVLEKKKKSRDTVQDIASAETSVPKLTFEDAKLELAKATRVYVLENAPFSEIVDDYLSSWKTDKKEWSKLWLTLFDDAVEKRETERPRSLQFLAELLLFWDPKFASKGRKCFNEVVKEMMEDEEMWEMRTEDCPKLASWFREHIVNTLLDRFDNLLFDEDVEGLLKERNCYL